MNDDCECKNKDAAVLFSHLDFLFEHFACNENSHAVALISSRESAFLQLLLCQASKKSDNEGCV